jgi:NADH dehydrogenase [ubiquinone] 1 alpha subcomplex assembly factor 7
VQALPDTVPLSLRLSKQIEANGPITIAEYMRLANAEYYNNGDPFGVAGDFITAPEVSQMFGELVGIWFADLYLRNDRPDKCSLVELGPGRGTLMADALRVMARFDFNPDVYFVETSGSLQSQQQDAVPDARAVETIDDLPEDGPILIIANEFFDALPIRQFVATHAGWRERIVTRERGNKFAAMPGTKAVDDLVPPEFRNAPSPSVYETSPQTAAIMYELATRIARQGGALLVIDYGYTQPGLGSTLQAVKQHQFADPFENPGGQDLTAHVNFLELANLARMRNLRVSGPVEQGSWLKALGIDARTDSLSVASPDRANDLKTMRDRLVEPSQMGSLFKVLSVSSENWPVPEGFAAPKPEL